MRISINCRSFLNWNFTGIGRYTSQLIRTLLSIDSSNDYLFYVPKSIFNVRRRIPKIRGKNVQMKIDWCKRGLDKTLGPVDVYHTPCPDSLNIRGAKIVVTIHDLIYKAFPQGQTPEMVESTDRLIKEAIQRADRIICCSQNTYNDFRKHFPIVNGKVSLIYQGVDQNTFYPIGPEESAVAAKTVRSHGLVDRYLLFVGTIEPRKNLKNLLWALTLLKSKGKYTGKLVVIGSHGWMSEDIANLVESMGLKKDVMFPGYVSDRELRHFYNRADALVFPSYYEGFGFPIVEAFCCGTPVVTSNVSSCPEIAGDAAVAVDPNSPEEIAAAVIRILEDQALREGLKGKALNRAKEFTLLNTAKKTLEVYEKAFTGS